MADGGILSMTDVTFRWPGRPGFALTVPAFAMAKGDAVMIVGDSGSGKSTLLSLICGTLRAASGSLHVAGTDLGRLSAAERDRFRADRIGVIFQQFNLLPYGSVRDNILLPLVFSPKRRGRATDVDAEVLRLCTAMGLEPEVIGMSAGRLSVGQQQRVAVARALIGQPELVVADEPTSALDQRAQTGFLDLLFEQMQVAGSSLLLVSHDTRLGRRFDRVERIEEIALTERKAA
ncbi:methionine ABC transporter ATP-binding protein [Pseudoponticoccus marisrubri]|uniref:Methionine ABC transporter ATP-binding protein n=2 Tax=Pseudoponticoccus marisrubri TaxID=1685382 RepID=A0A0W7WDX4_9RHOB|nr:methionine ABC transporter ATP-binding protein [Pseudoponticoccus marisrubri]